jgi:ribonuclease P protein component
VTDASFPRSVRILRSADFERLRKTGKRYHARNFRADVAIRETGGDARLGLTVSRRVSKSAVRRNRIKRICRDSFRLHRAQLPSLDIVLSAGPQANARDNAELRADLVQLWQRLAQSGQATVGKPA